MVALFLPIWAMLPTVNGLMGFSFPTQPWNRLLLPCWSKGKSEVQRLSNLGKLIQSRFVLPILEISSSTVLSALKSYLKMMASEIRLLRWLLILKWPIWPIWQNQKKRRFGKNLRRQIHVYWRLKILRATQSLQLEKLRLSSRIIRLILWKYLWQRILERSRSRWVIHRAYLKRKVLLKCGHNRLSYQSLCLRTIQNRRVLQHQSSLLKAPRFLQVSRYQKQHLNLWVF